jgi:hypothetical protein
LQIAESNKEDGRMVSKYCAMYVTYKDGKELFYLRIILLETSMFRHGVSLGATTFEDRESTKKFAEMVDEYIDTWLIQRSIAASEASELTMPPGA